MKHYRSYMDRITAPARLRQRVLEAAEQGARPRRPARRLTLRMAALSALSLIHICKIQFLAACSGATSSLPTMRVRQMKMPRNRAAAAMPTG